MARKRYMTEQIIPLLREAEVRLGRGATVELGANQHVALADEPEALFELRPVGGVCPSK